MEREERRRTGGEGKGRGGEGRELTYIHEATILLKTVNSVGTGFIDDVHDPCWK